MSARPRVRAALQRDSVVGDRHAEVDPQRAVVVARVRRRGRGAHLQDLGVVGVEARGARGRERRGRVVGDAREGAEARPRDARHRASALVVAGGRRGFAARRVVDAARRRGGETRRDSVGACWPGFSARAAAQRWLWSLGFASPHTVSVALCARVELPHVSTTSLSAESRVVRGSAWRGGQMNCD